MNPAILKGLWIYGLILWAYVAATILDPITAPFQTAPLSVYVPLPTDLVGVVAFIISFVAFVLWEDGR